MKEKPDSDKYYAYLFGTFRVYKNGEPLGRGAPGLISASNLLKWFLIHPDRTIGSRELLRVLGSDIGEAAQARLNRSLHYLRTYIASGWDASPTFNSNKAYGYMFLPAGRWGVDLGDVYATLATASRSREIGDVEGEMKALESLTHLDELAFLPGDLYNDLFYEVRLDATQKCRDSRDRLLELYVMSGRTVEALQLGLVTLDEDPHSEQAAWAVAHAQLHAGNPVSALRTLLTLRDRLQQDMGSRPSQKVLHLEAALRNSE